MDPADLDPSVCRIPVIVKISDVVVLPWSPFSLMLDYFLFSSSFFDVHAMSSSLYNLFLRADLGLFVFSLDFISCSVCLDKVH